MKRRDIDLERWQVSANERSNSDEPYVLSQSVLVASADSNDDDLPQQCSMHGFHLRSSISNKSYQAAIISNLVNKNNDDDHDDDNKSIKEVLW